MEYDNAAWRQRRQLVQINRIASRRVSFPFVSCLFCLSWPSLPSFLPRAHNVRFADQADLQRPADKRTPDIPTYSETVREGGNSHAAARSSAMDRRVFPRTGERRGASGEGTFLFVQTRRSRVSRALRSPFPLILPFLGSIIHRATCAISCYEEDLALKKTNVRLFNFREKPFQNLAYAFKTPYRKKILRS